MEPAVNETLTCALVEERALVERYIGDTLTDAHGRADFEAHVIACPRCQDEIRLAMTARAELAPLAAGTRRARRVLPLGLGIALAASIAAIILSRAAGTSTRWQDLGAVPVAPIYLGVEVRGTPVRGDSLLALAMKAYDDRRYDAASAGLTGALAAGTDSAPAEFFLGAALLMLDRPEAAAETFGRVIALGDTPYLGEARFYRAKALLRQGNGAAALSELHAVASSSSAVSGWARALADSVESRMRR